MMTPCCILSRLYVEFAADYSANAACEAASDEMQLDEELHTSEMTC
jgi:hypothetical protein